MRRFLVLLAVLLFPGIVFGATASSLSQHGITWNFDKAYEYGTYANGDYWVKTDAGTGYVRVTSISPATTTSGGDRVHGWEVNPGCFAQGFDGRTNNRYNSSLMPSLPYNATAGKSLVKAISLIPCVNSACRPVLKTVSILTVVGSVPANNGATVFRPPYVGTNKPNYSTNSIRWDRIPSYAPVSNTPAMSTALGYVEKVQFDHVSGIYGGQTRPYDHMHFYGADINWYQGDAVLRMMLNDSQAAKTPLVIAIIQSGIDHYHFILEGQTWPRGSGEQPGRILTPLVASYLLNNTTMQNVVTSRSSDTHYPYEQYILARRVNNRVLWGDTTGSESVYWDKLEGGHSAPGSATIRDPYGYIDGGYSPGRVYQECCTSQGFKQTALTMILMPGLQNLWDFSDELIEYADRWVTHGTWTLPDPCAPVGGTRGVHYGPDGSGGCIKGSGRFPSYHGTNKDAGLRYSAFAAAMWNAYRYDTNPPPPPPQTEYYIRSGATGANNGLNWTDAFTQLPNTLVRGNTYYVADGTYPAYTFNTAASGTTFITVRKATVANHGTNTGWQDAYGDGFAEWPQWSFATSYWDINGANGKWASDIPDYESYGFQVRRTTTGSGHLIRSTVAGTSNLYFNRIRAYFQNTNTWHTASDIVSLNGSTITFANSWLHDAGRHGVNWLGGSNHILREIVIERTGRGQHAMNWSPAETSSAVLYSSGIGSGVVRHSYIRDWRSNGAIIYSGSNASMKVHGNIFTHTGYYGVQGDGIGMVDSLSGASGVAAVVYNNTFSDVRYNAKIFSTGTYTSRDTRNNLFYSVKLSTGGAVSIGGTHDYNWFYDSGTQTETNIQNGTGDPFFSRSGNNFALLRSTSAGDTSIGAEYQDDMFGARRGLDTIWDRGAIEFNWDGSVEETCEVDPAYCEDADTCISYWPDHYWWEDTEECRSGPPPGTPYTPAGYGARIYGL